MTVNHGTYYLDTSVKRTTQQTEAYIKLKDWGKTPAVPADEFCDARSVNEFEAKGAYYLFFSLPSPRPSRPIRSMSGAGFDINSVKAVRPRLTATPVRSRQRGPG